MASGLEQLGQLMQIKNQVDSSKMAGLKYQQGLDSQAYKRNQDIISNKQSDRTYDLNALVQKRLQGDRDIKKQAGLDKKEFQSVYNTNVPELIDAYAGNRRGFVSELSSLGGYPGADKDSLKSAIELYDSTYGKQPSGRGNIINNLTDPNREGGTRSVFIPPGASPEQYQYFDTDATASTQLAQSPSNRGNITTQIEMSKLEVNELEDLNKNAWEGIVRATKAEQGVAQMEAVLKDFKPGPGINFRMIPNKLKDYIGLEPDKNYTSLQVFESFVGKGMLAARDTKGEIGGLPGATSDRDLEVLRSIVANTKMPADAIKIMLNFQKQEIERKKNIYQITNSHRDKVSKLKDKLVKYMEDNPYKILDATSVQNVGEMSDEDLLKF